MNCFQEIVNQKKEDDENKEKIITSIDQKAARSVFENPVVERYSILSSLQLYSKTQKKYYYFF